MFNALLYRAFFVMKLENNKYYLIKNALFGTDDYFVRQYNAEKHAFLDGTFVYGKADEYVVLAECEVKQNNENNA